MTVIVKPSTPVRDNPDFALEEVIVRLARPDEHREWDRLVNELHYLGFRQFAGRGLRYIAEWRGQWVALLGRQTGVFQCAPRDEWLGWLSDCTNQNIRTTVEQAVIECNVEAGLAERVLATLPTLDSTCAMARMDVSVRGNWDWWECPSKANPSPGDGEPFAVKCADAVRRAAAEFQAREMSDSEVQTRIEQQCGERSAAFLTYTGILGEGCPQAAAEHHSLAVAMKSILGASMRNDHAAADRASYLPCL